jgi:hypothetical protein
VRGISGYIKDYRQELESDVWAMPPLYHRVWQYLKYKANHQTAKIPMRDGSFLTLQPGQHLTSIRKIANGVGYYERSQWKEPNVKTIKVILDWLVKQNMITIESNSKYTLISLINWEKYQSNSDEGNARETLGKHSVDTNKNDKECIKNEINVVVDNTREGESGGVPSTGLLGDPPLPNEGEIPHTPKTDEVDRIAAYYMTLKGKGPDYPATVKDYQTIKSIVSQKIPLEIIYAGIKQSFDEFRPSYPGDEIKSFGYCKKIILSNYYRDKARKEAENAKHSQRDGEHHSSAFNYDELSL